MKILKNKKKIIRRKSPLPGTSKDARPIWTAIFKEYPPRYFSPAIYGLLFAYCEDIAARNRIIQQLSEMGPLLENKVTGGYQKNPLYGTPKKMEKTIRDLHRTLDLKPELLDRFCKPSLEIVRENE